MEFFSNIVERYKTKYRNGELLSYKTIHIIRVRSWKLGLFHFGVMGILVFGYLCWELIYLHHYYSTEDPSGFINSWADNRMAAIEAEINDPDPWYCDNPDTNYDYGGGWVYYNNTCQKIWTLAEIANKGENQFSLITYLQETQYKHNDSGYYYLKSNNYFYPWVEYTEMWFSHTVTHSHGPVYSNPQTTIYDHNGNKVDEFEKGETIWYNILDWVKFSGVNLDSRNTDSGGLGPPTEEWPFYRMTGVAIQMSLEYTNIHYDQPFDTSLKCKLKVSHTDSTWSSLASQVIRVTSYNDEEISEQVIDKYRYAIRFNFMFKGEAGYVDWMAILFTLINAVVVTGIATTLVDFLSLHVLKFKDTFQTFKFENVSLRRSDSSGNEMSEINASN